jgi:hypothetical protein
MAAQRTDLPRQSESGNGGHELGDPWHPTLRGWWRLAYKDPFGSGRPQPPAHDNTVGGTIVAAVNDVVTAAKNYGIGMLSGLGSLVEAVTHPVQTQIDAVSFAATFLSDPGATIAAIGRSITGNFDSPDRAQQFIGKTIFGVLTALVTKRLLPELPAAPAKVSVVSGVRSAISGAVKAAVSGARGGLTWLRNKIFGPPAAKTALHGHHPLPKFLGGDASQLLSKLDPKLHTEFHQLLRQNLKDAGIPLNVGGRGGSAADWAQYMQFNPAAQRTAFDSVLNASRAIDTKYGTQITQDVWRNVMQGNFTPYP